MEIIELAYDKKVELNDEYVVAIGNFDGIHLGHREIIKRACRIAKDKQLKLAVMSFNISPKQLVNKINNYYLLRSFQQKEKILSELEVVTMFLIHFDENIQNMEPHQFIREMIINNNVKYLVCGFDFSFGQKKSGNVHVLSEFREFNTIVVPRMEYNNHKIGSSYIHELLSLGRIQEANYLLVQPYSIIGQVIHGKAKGHLLGYPTANIRPLINYRIPASGVYATRIMINNKKYLAMTNIGNNPTFNYTFTTSIETHIFDFNEDIYGQEVELEFIDFIRNEKIFEDMEDLAKQLAYDKQEIIEKYGDLSEEA